MKYIVLWIVWKVIEIPCPDQWRYDLYFGQGNFNCLVFHGQYIPIEHNAGFNTFNVADSFYKERVKDCNESTYLVSDDFGNRRVFKMLLNGAIDSVRIDSIFIK